MDIDLDGIQKKLILNYRFQVLAFIVLGIVYARGAWNTFGVLFLAADAGHQCNHDADSPVVETPQFSSLPSNFSTGNASYIGVIGKSQPSVIAVKKCSLITQGENGTNVTVPCNDWKFGTEFESTIVSEWKLVCVRAYLTELSTTLYMVGSMFGALLISPLSDKFGRRLILLLCLLAQAIVGSCVSLSPNYAIFTTLRFIVGFFNMGIALCAYVMMTEVFPAMYRTVPCCGIQIFWAVGIMLTALFGYVVRDWRHLQLVFSLPNVLCVVMVWFLPESLPWLVARKYLGRAQNVIERIARFNSVECPNDLFLYESTSMTRRNPDNNSPSAHFVSDQPLLSGAMSHQDAVRLLSQSSVSQSQSQTEDSSTQQDQVNITAEPVSGPDSNGLSTPNGEMAQTPVDPEVQIAEQSSHINLQMVDGRGNEIRREREQIKLESVFALCRSRRILRYSCIMFYLFFVNSLSYFGISLSTPTLHGNQFFNLFLLGAVEIPAYIICLLLCERIGRKVPLCIFLLLCGVMNITGMLISEEASSGMSGVRVGFVMLGKFAITGSYSTVYLYSAELFPTAVRNHAVGVSSFFENFGSIAAPFIVYFAKSHPELPMVLFGIVSVTGGLMVLALPETNHRPLPETIEEVESWGMCKRRASQR